jgi:diguanylate cyclase (GGDEF)-like protein
MYLNERLMENPPTVPDSMRDGQSKPPGDFISILMGELFRQDSTDGCLQSFLQTVSGVLGGCPAIYLKYIANRRMLVAAHGHNLPETPLKGLGVDFNQHSKTFRISHLRKPEDLPEVQALCREVFQVDSFLAYPVDAMGEVQGIMIFLSGTVSGEQRGVVETAMPLLDRVVSLFEAQKRLHTSTVKDASTEVFTRSYFLARATEEVARARRTSSPLSMLLLAVDQYGHLVSTYGAEEGNTVLRMLLRIIEKHSRINDVIGRLGPDEFGILLPHTNLKGALIKAERLRRIVESADFSRVIASMPSLTISIGVSEYPTLCRDADELQQTADEALFHVRKEQNRVCAATVPDGFVADFQVNEKGI